MQTDKISFDVCSHREHVEDCIINNGGYKTWAILISGKDTGFEMIPTPN